MILIRLILCLALWATPAVPAEPSEETANIFNNAAYEAIECAAFYSILGATLLVGSNEGRNDPESAERAAQHAASLLVWAQVLTAKAGLLPETVEARFSLAEEEQMKRINSSSANISILLAEHQECSTVAEDPAARLVYWLDRELRPTP